MNINFVNKGKIHNFDIPANATLKYIKNIAVNLLGETGKDPFDIIYENKKFSSYPPNKMFINLVTDDNSIIYLTIIPYNQNNNSDSSTFSSEKLAEEDNYCNKRNLIYKSLKLKKTPIKIQKNSGKNKDNSFAENDSKKENEALSLIKKLIKKIKNEEGISNFSKKINDYQEKRMKYIQKLLVDFDKNENNVNEYLSNFYSYISNLSTFKNNIPKNRNKTNITSKSLDQIKGNQVYNDSNKKINEINKYIKLNNNLENEANEVNKINNKIFNDSDIISENQLPSNKTKSTSILPLLTPNINKLKNFIFNTENNIEKSKANINYKQNIFNKSNSRNSTSNNTVIKKSNKTIFLYNRNDNLNFTKTVNKEENEAKTVKLLNDFENEKEKSDKINYLISKSDNKLNTNNEININNNLSTFSNKNIEHHSSKRGLSDFYGSSSKEALKLFSNVNNVKVSYYDEFNEGIDVKIGGESVDKIKKKENTIYIHHNKKEHTVNKRNHDNLKLNFSMGKNRHNRKFLFTRALNSRCMHRDKKRSKAKIKKTVAPNSDFIY